MKRIAGLLGLSERGPVVPTGADPAPPLRRTTLARIDTSVQDFSEPVNGDDRFHATGWAARQALGDDPCTRSKARLNASSAS
jgi:hypothetical protein